MSRVAKAPVVLPQSVDLSVEQDILVIKGPKGTLNHKFNKLVKVVKTDTTPINVEFHPITTDPKAWAQAGTLRALVQNMVRGVTAGFEQGLDLIGVGYRAQAKPGSVSLSLGFSHPVEYKLPEGVLAETPTNTTILLKGIDKQLVGQVASEIRALRPPEPYKGKGVRYTGEVIVLKETKKK